MTDNRKIDRETLLRRALYLRGEIHYRMSLMNFEYPEVPVVGRKTTYSLDGWKRQIKTLNDELLEHEAILFGGEEPAELGQIVIETEVGADDVKKE